MKLRTGVARILAIAQARVWLIEMASEILPPVRFGCALKLRGT